MGRQECVYETIPKNQIAFITSASNNKERIPENFNVEIEVGFLLSDIHGAETEKGSVDVFLKAPNGETIYTKQGVKEDAFRVNAHGPIEDWQLCFKLASRNHVGSHALTIELSYFTINLKILVGTEHEKGKDLSNVESIELPSSEDLLNTEDVSKVVSGIKHVSLQLSSMKAQQKYLKMRTERHLLTIQSTYTRTLIWSAIQAFFIVAASFAQVMAVRQFFKTTGDKFFKV